MKYDSLNIAGFKPFNMDAITLERINDKMDQSMNATIEGNQLKRFRALKTVFFNTIFKFSDDEINIFKDKIKVLNNIFKTHPLKTSKHEMQRFYELRMDEIEIKLDDMEEDINKLLYKVNIINLKKPNSKYILNEDW